MSNAPAAVAITPLLCPADDVRARPVVKHLRSWCLQVVEIILDGKEVTVQDVLRHQRWRPTTRSARHKLAKFVKDHEHLLALDPTSPEGAPP